MTRQVSEVAPVISTELLGKLIVCYTQRNQLPVDYSLFAESVFSMWDSDELDRLVISWATTQAPFVRKVGEHSLPNQPSIICSHEEVKFSLESNHLSFRDLQTGANKFCGDSSGFGSEFRLVLEFDDNLVTGKKVAK